MPLIKRPFRFLGAVLALLALLALWLLPVEQMSAPAGMLSGFLLAGGLGVYWAGWALEPRR